MISARTLAAAALAMLWVPAHADLYISPVVKDTVEYLPQQIGDPAVSGSSTIHGSFHMGQHNQSDTNLLRYGTNVPLFVALEHIVPESEAWTVHLDQGMENQVVNWEGGTTWQGVLTAIADQNHLSLVMNHKDRVVGVARSEDLAIHLAKTIPEVWRLTPGKTLKENLEVWAEQANWSLSWSDELTIDYPITQSATLTGSFTGTGGVVDRLISAFKNEPIPLTAVFYTQNNVVRVREAGFAQGAN